VQDEGLVDASLIQGILLSSMVSDPPAMSDEVKHWLPEAVWARLAAAERSMGAAYGNFAELCDSVNLDCDEWQQWYNLPTPEADRPPGRLGNGSELEKLLLLRIMRPDRVPFALRTFISTALGEEYVQMAPYDVRKTYSKSSKSTPIFFVLFPGVDPTPWVEELGASMGVTQANGLFANISMGQGQEGPAEATLERMAGAGGWVLLQNVHLMQTWLPTLERKLEVLAETASNKFRCFVSAEPPPISYLKNVPEGLLQSSLKVRTTLRAMCVCPLRALAHSTLCALAGRERAAFRSSVELPARMGQV
jgi:dynein heavy chain